MKSEVHREALDQALRIALGTSQPALRRQALARAATHLVHPKLVLESPLLTDSHPWRREALAVSDAFEAVTNGMEQAELLDALEDIEDDSPFQPWRHLILSIHFYYEGLDEAVAAHLSAISEDSPVHILAATLAALVGRTRRLSTAQNRLAEALAQPDPLAVQWNQDIAEGLETGDESLFWGALTDWLEHLAPVSPDRAQAALLWAWNQLEWRDFDEAALLDMGVSLWGRAEAYRLAALGTLNWDAEGASLLWARFLVTSAKDGADEQTVREARSLLDRFRGAAEQTGTTAEGREVWSHLAWAWNTEARSRGWLHLEIAEARRAPEYNLPVAGDQLDLFA